MSATPTARSADLVVDDDVDGATGRNAQLRQVQRLGDHALAGERRVAVQEQRQDGVLAGEVEPVLLGPDDALEDGVDRLEVGRVRREVDLGTSPPRGGTLPRCRGGI